MRTFLAIMMVVLLLLLAASFASAQSVSLWSIGPSAGIASNGEGSIAIGVGEPIAGTSDNLVAGFWGIAGQLGNLSAVEESPALPLKWEIGSAYPNPFNPSTQVVITMPIAAPVRAEVYNVLGRRVAVLANEIRPAGVHRLLWDASGMASGVYFLRTEVPGRMHRMQKLVLIK